MNKTNLLISSCFLSVLSNSAFAAMDIRGERTSFYERNKPKPIGFNYTYVETAYINTIVNNSNANDDSAQGIGAKISFQATQNISASLKFTGNGYTFGNQFVESTEVHIGVNYHHNLNKVIDIYGEFNVISIDFEDPNNANTSTSASGGSLNFGLRQRINSDMEWGVSVGALNIEDETNTMVRLKYAYGADDETQYFGGLEAIDTDNQTITVFLGMRFNYD